MSTIEVRTSYGIVYTVPYSDERLQKLKEQTADRTGFVDVSDEHVQRGIPANTVRALTVV